MLCSACYGQKEPDAWGQALKAGAGAAKKEAGQESGSELNPVGVRLWYWLKRPWSLLGGQLFCPGSGPRLLWPSTMTVGSPGGQAPIPRGKAGGRDEKEALHIQCLGLELRYMLAALSCWFCHSLSPWPLRGHLAFCASLCTPGVSLPPRLAANPRDSWLPLLSSPLSPFHLLGRLYFTSLSP